MALKRYTLSFAASVDHVPDHPERTARRSISWDVEYQVWPSRAAMIASIRMQEKRAPHRTDWKECKSEFLKGFVTAKAHETAVI